ncbi:BCCT family transporter [Mariniluteicoccus flavus]
MTDESTTAEKTSAEKTSADKTSADETAARQRRRLRRANPSGVAHPALADVVARGRDRHDQPRLDWVVFGIAAVVSLAFVTWGLVSPKGLGSAATAGLTEVVKYAGWLFVLVASGFVVFVLWLAASRYGSIPLGQDGEKPEYSTASWIAMMFSAGMGIGLMFFGVSEPLSHFAKPLSGTAEAMSGPAINKAMATTMFHWALHPWAMYALVGVSLAYGMYRKGRRSLFSAAFVPLIGRRASEGVGGRLIDTLAVFATLFGSATSLGLGALQIASGLEIVAGIGKPGNTMLVIIIATLTVAFVLSAVSGIARGIQLLSNINMYLALALAVFVFVFGPTVFILNLLPVTLGTYLADLPTMAARTGVAGPAVAEWLGSWTIFYWAWWLSWTPFVGHFIAQISRGRTIRQFVSGVLLVPSLVSLVWFAIFGGAGIAAQRAGTDLAGADGVEAQFFGLLQTMPLASVTGVLVMVLVAIFFVSGADAASIVMGSMTERGAIHPRKQTVIFWGVATGLVAIVALLSGGDDALQGLQTITIIAAAPFALVLIGLAVALVRDLGQDPLMIRRDMALDAVRSAVVTGLLEHGDEFEIAVVPTTDDPRAPTVTGVVPVSTPADSRRQPTDAAKTVTDPR